MQEVILALLPEIAGIVILTPLFSFLWDWFYYRLPLQKLIGIFIRENRLIIFFSGHIYRAQYENSLSMFEKCNISNGLALGYVQNCILNRVSLLSSWKQIAVEINEGLPAEWRSYVVIGLEHPQAAALMKNEQHCPIRLNDDRFVIKHGPYQVSLPRNLETWHDDELSEGIIAKFPISGNGSEELGYVLIVGGIGPEGAASAGYYLWRNWRELARKYDKEGFICHLQVPSTYSHRQPIIRYRSALKS